MRLCKQPTERTVQNPRNLGNRPLNEVLWILPEFNTKPNWCLIPRVHSYRKGIWQSHYKQAHHSPTGADRALLCQAMSPTSQLPSTTAHVQRRPRHTPFSAVQARLTPAPAQRGHENAQNTPTHVDRSPIEQYQYQNQYQDRYTAENNKNSEGGNFQNNERFCSGILSRYLVCDDREMDSFTDKYKLWYEWRMCFPSSCCRTCLPFFLFSPFLGRKKKNTRTISRPGL